jgi:serine protease Do
VAARALAAVALVGLASASVDARQWSWLGVRIRDLSEQEMEEVAAKHGIREGFGVVIVEVIEGAPAATAGIKSGDIVVAFEDRPVVDTRMLQRLIGSASMEKAARLTVLRPGGRRAVQVRLAAMPRDVVGERVAAEFGFVLRELEGELAGRRPVSSAPFVTFVVQGSTAEKAGLEVGDVILQVDDRAVLSREAARDALADATPERPLRLTVRRGESHVTLTLPAP